MALLLTWCAVAGFVVALGWQIQAMVALSVLVAIASFAVQLAAGPLDAVLGTFAELVLFQGAYLGGTVLCGFLSIGRVDVGIDTAER